MTEGISNEYLENSIKTITEANDLPQIERAQMLIVFNHLLKKCYEIDPWLPIDENTPKDKEILMYFTGGVKVVTRWFTTSKGGYWFTGNDDYIGQPTHYKLLPEDPK